jgi:uncharacterized membrane protein
MTYDHCEEAAVEIHAPADAIFNYLDDQTKLGSHMEKPSMMMMGGRMTYVFDEAKGRAVGSVIKMGGGMLGLRLSVEEVVIEHAPPHRKAWETRGHPHLLIIGAYRMGFEIAAAGDRQRLRVFIDYNHPRSAPGRVLAVFLARMYARWCVTRMADDAASHFSEMTPPRLAPGIRTSL